MKINLVALGDDTMASHRFRVLKSYELLTQLGHDVTIKRHPDLDADYNFYHKHINPEQIIHWMENDKTKKIFDVCDDHFDREFGNFYKDACNAADILTCTNKRMEKRLKKLFPKKQVQVFYDPINTIAANPTQNLMEDYKVIWFGHQTNFNDALPWLREVAELRLDLTVVSNMNIKGGDFTFLPYVEGWVEENLRNYDIVLLPTGDTMNQPWINMKSENRFVDAVNAGCLVIFNNVNLYKDMAPYGLYVTGSIGKALEGLDEDLVHRIEEGQEYIKKYSDEEIKKQWKNLLSSI